MTAELDHCYATLSGDRLIIGNDRIERAYAWHGGDLVSRQISDLQHGGKWLSTREAPDMTFPNAESQPVADGSFEVQSVPQSALHEAHLQATVVCRRGDLWLKRVFSIFPGVPALRCQLYLKGAAAGPWYRRTTDSAELTNLERVGDDDGPAFAPILDTVAINRAHVQCRAVEFWDVTDRHNNLVQSVSHRPYRSAAPLRGNLLLATDIFADRGLFMLKEAPCSSVQLSYPGYDFQAEADELTVVGPGMAPTDLHADRWIRAYGWVIGVGSGSEESVLLALRAYQHTWRRLLPERDEMILVNTWGDRSQDRRIGEAFALAEVAAAARLGATHLQLDDGWQNGRTTNSAQAGGTIEDMWAHDDFWGVHPTRFPNGLAPVLAAAAANDIKIALWYAPSRTNAYADWEKDAAQLLKLWRDHGVHTFKIDMVKLPSKQADLNLRAMFDRVLTESAGAISFNLDATANRRFGYHDATDYGNVFLENRYTDWLNYYPTWTLRNLWQLSRYVPPQRLQIECLNTWRNAANYPADDPLAPARVGFAFAMAVTFAAQPLLWFESSELPAAAFAMSAELQSYRAHQGALHACPIMPIGEEPNGASWTGFQAVGEDHGYLLVYREFTDRARAALGLWQVRPGDRIELAPVLGHGRETACVVSEAGTIDFELPAPWRYAMFRYRRRH